jgi:hypothetical protein
VRELQAVKTAIRSETKDLTRLIMKRNRRKILGKPRRSDQLAASVTPAPAIYETTFEGLPVRIVRKQVHRNEYLMHFFCAIGDSIDEGESVAFCKNLLGTGLIDERIYGVMKEALSNASLSDLDPSTQNKVRARMFKQMLLTFMKS